jgi:hypothetical protein
MESESSTMKMVSYFLRVSSTFSDVPAEALGGSGVCVVGHGGTGCVLVWIC